MIKINEAKELINADLKTVLQESKTYIESNIIELCAISNVKSGNCSEDCKFCTQSAHYETDSPTYPLMSYDEIEPGVKFMDTNGVNRHCLVMSGKSLSRKDEDILAEYYSELSSKFGMTFCSSVGMVTKSQAEKLKKAGLNRYHHNLEVGPRYYEKICTTHKYQERVEALRIAKEAGLETCSGGIIGANESWDDRLEMIQDIVSLDVDSVTFNILNPMPGTPMEIQQNISEEEILRCVAIYKMMLGPKVSLRFCAGRQRYSYEFQKQAMDAGITSIMVGDYLTIDGNNFQNDLNFLSDNGYEIKKK